MPYIPIIVNGGGNTSPEAAISMTIVFFAIGLILLGIYYLTRKDKDTEMFDTVSGIFSLIFLAIGFIMVIAIILMFLTTLVKNLLF